MEAVSCHDIAAIRACILLNIQGYNNVDRGGTGEAGWTLRANHGGGYNYRLAPLGAPLTEATFNKIPLDFVGPSILRWDRNESSQLAFNTTERGWDTRVGTTPPNSMWRKNPVSATMACVLSAQPSSLTQVLSFAQMCSTGDG